MAEAYRVKADVSLPRAVREVEEKVDGVKVYETTGHNYAAGSYVLAKDITPPLRERAENGELDHLLEPVSVEEAENAQLDEQYGTFVPEHEAERVVLEDYGHRVVPREQVLDLRSAGASEAASALQAAKDAGLDERPNFSLDGSNLNEVPVEELEGVEQPPGLLLGNDKEQAEAVAETDRPKTAKKSTARKSAQDNVTEKTSANEEENK